jgi:hypothetical protein
MSKALVGLLAVLCGCEIRASTPDRLAWDPQDLAAKESTTIALAKLAVVDYSALTAELQMSPEIKLGQPVRLELVVKNNADRPLWLEFGDSTHAFDVAVTDLNGREVWNRSLAIRGQPNYAMLRRIPIPPGQTVRFADIWDQRTNGGSRVSPGSYSVQGTLDTDESRETRVDMITSPKTLIIKR